MLEKFAFLGKDQNSHLLTKILQSSTSKHGLKTIDERLSKEDKWNKTKIRLWKVLQTKLHSIVTKILFIDFLKDNIFENNAIFRDGV